MSTKPREQPDVSPCTRVPILLILISTLQEAALKFLEDGDHDQLTNLLAEVCPVDDENSNALDAARDKLASLPQWHS